MRDTIGIFIYILFHVLLPAIIVAIIAITLIQGCANTEYNKALKEYNNGQCECGGNYKFINYTQGYCSQAYVFQCDDCNKIIILNENPLK